MCGQSRTLPWLPLYSCVWTKQNPPLLCILLCVDKAESSLVYFVVCGQSRTPPPPTPWFPLYSCVWTKQNPPLCILLCVDKAEPFLGFLFTAVCGQSRTLPWLPLYSCVWTKQNPPLASSLQLCVDKAEPSLGFLFTAVCGQSRTLPGLPLYNCMWTKQCKDRGPRDTAYKIVGRAEKTRRDQAWSHQRPCRQGHRRRELFASPS